MDCQVLSGPEKRCGSAKHEPNAAAKKNLVFMTRDYNLLWHFGKVALLPIDISAVGVAERLPSPVDFLAEVNCTLRVHATDIKERARRHGKGLHLNLWI